MAPLTRQETAKVGGRRKADAPADVLNPAGRPQQRNRARPRALAWAHAGPTWGPRELLGTTISVAAIEPAGSVSQTRAGLGQLARNSGRWDRPARISETPTQKKRPPGGGLLQSIWTAYTIETLALRLRSPA